MISGGTEIKSDAAGIQLTSANLNVAKKGQDVIGESISWVISRVH
jgi:hypothetical protein